MSNEITYKNIDNKIMDNLEILSKLSLSSSEREKTIEEQYCKLDAVIPTDESCFEYSESNDEITITDYYLYDSTTL